MLMNEIYDDYAYTIVTKPYICWECPKNERHFDVFHYIILN